MNFVEDGKLGGIRETSDGYLVTSALTARTGVQAYSGAEIGIPDKPIVQVYRPDTEVFSKDSLASYAHKPMTNDHPDAAVSSENWKDLAIGLIGDEIARDGEFVRVPLILMDARAIKDVKAGKRELSAGYTATIVVGDGVTPSGEKYDAIQKDIKINHIALVSKGRAGEKARIGDAAPVSWGAIPVTDERTSPMTKVIMVDGLQVETTDAGAAAIEKLVKDIDKLMGDAAASATAHLAAIAAKDTEIGTLKAELKTARDAAPDAAALDRLVSDRVQVIASAKALDPAIVVDGVSNPDIRKAAVMKVMGADAVKDASEAEVSGMFKALTKDRKTADPLAGVAPAPAGSFFGDADNGQEAYEKRIRDAHKTAAA